ncbi:hypothetical protein MRB53_016834 [Persea americana]|uniref:Uncharacterized protein n=1 Tax=Persea americana TaxID=3435 RepID=A0ACC2M3E0_PERAE|nr:hypothetical protein MRB53_016834 [Persea americana]
MLKTCYTPACLFPKIRVPPAQEKPSPRENLIPLPFFAEAPNDGRSSSYEVAETVEEKGSDKEAAIGERRKEIRGFGVSLQARTICSSLRSLQYREALLTFRCILGKRRKPGTFSLKRGENEMWK